eukprot:scaffold5761_cov88-Skeletonema_marinoi.AAC.1
MASFGGSLPYLRLRVLPFCHLSQVLTRSLICVRIPCQYMIEAMVSSILSLPGCWRYSWYHHSTFACNELLPLNFHFVVVTLVTCDDVIMSSSDLSPMIFHSIIIDGPSSFVLIHSCVVITSEPLVLQLQLDLVLHICQFEQTIPTAPLPTTIIYVTPTAVIASSATPIAALAFHSSRSTITFCALEFHPSYSIYFFIQQSYYVLQLFHFFHAVVQCSVVLAPSNRM